MCAAANLRILKPTARRALVHRMIRERRRILCQRIRGARNEITALRLGSRAREAIANERTRVRETRVHVASSPREDVVQ